MKRIKKMTSEEFPGEIFPSTEKSSEEAAAATVVSNLQFGNEKLKFHPLLTMNPNSLIMLMICYHCVGLFGLYLILTGQIRWQTILFYFCVVQIQHIGNCAGAHRLWSHRSYKANTGLRLILAFLQTLCFQITLWDWVVIHRVHHKYVDTEKDPHNSEKGFFFSHMSWIWHFDEKKFEQDCKGIDLSDLHSDKIVMFQKKHWFALNLLFVFLLPRVIPWLFWDETFMGASHVAVLGNLWTQHATWSINSIAHLWGDKPYDKSIKPTDMKFLSLISGGEGWHNYHHVFPQDYRGRELPSYGFNLSTLFIDFFASIGWAYDLKSPSDKVIDDRAKRTGDGSRRRNILLK